MAARLVTARQEACISGEEMLLERHQCPGILVRASSHLSFPSAVPVLGHLARWLRPVDEMELGKGKYFFTKSKTLSTKSLHQPMQRA